MIWVPAFAGMSGVGEGVAVKRRLSDAQVMAAIVLWLTHILRPGLHEQRFKIA
jgi:hypothetical protein